MTRTRPAHDVNEDDRLAALDDLRALETDPSASLRRICELAREIFGTPTASVSLIDRDTQWIKAAAGLDVASMPREGTFCNHTIQGDGVLVVPDALADPRFADSPWVRGEAGIRFYAGAPLVAGSGARVGAICVFDGAPRHLSAREVGILEKLADAVVAELRTHRDELNAAGRMAELERSAGEAALHAEEDRRRNRLLEESGSPEGSGSWEIDLETGRVTWSDGLYRLLGSYPGCGQAPARLFRDRVHPEDVHLLEEARVAVEKARSFSIDVRIVNDDGRVRHLSSRGEPIGVAGLQPRRMVGVVRDVSHEKAIEAALRESEDHHRHAVELSPQIPWTAAPDGSILEAAPRWRSLTGLSEEETLGTGWARALHPDDLPGTLASWEDALRSGTSLDIRYRVRSHSGEHRWFRAYAAPRLAPDGTVLRWYGTLEDIHERKLAEDALKRSEAFSRSILDSSSDCMVVLDLEGRVRSFNARACSLPELRGGEALRGAEWSELWPTEVRNAAREAVEAACRGGQGHFSGRFEAASGASTWWDVSVDPVRGEYGCVTHVLAVSRDVTEHRRLRDEAEAARRRLSAVLESTTDNVIVLDRDRRITYLNERAAAFLSQSRPIEVGANFWEVYPDYVGGVFDHHYTQALATGTAVRFEAYLDHAERWLDVNACPGEGGLSIFFRDVTEAKQAREDLVRLAHNDPLTGLANRTRFNEALEEAFGRRHHAEVAVLLLDLDLFKEVNDTLGHPVGDVLLRQVAVRLRRAIGRNGFLARLGGDEFAIIHRAGGGRATARSLADKLLSCFARTFPIAGSSITLGASVGIATSACPHASTEELFKAADIALYRAKEEGRGTVRAYDAPMSERVRARQSLKQDLVAALDRSELRLVYQPILDLASEGIVGAEALLRWRHPSRGEIPPAEFIPLAEETGLILPMGEWILETACREAASWPPHVRIAVNVSPVQFRSETLPLRVMAALCRSGLECERLELEITESVLLHDSANNMRILHALKEAGIRIALDDFGTGFSSLSYLRQFPFDKLKLDRSFVGDIGRSPQSEAIVRAAGELGRALSMTTTAEGVETAEQLVWLRASGWSQAQGYLIARPLEAVDLRTMFAAPLVPFTQGRGKPRSNRSSNR